jgi:hypothetical protein
MSKLSNLNYNNISVKTDSTVKLIKELSKLGVFRKKSKKRPKSTVTDSDMVGYVNSVKGPQLRNIAPIQQIVPGLSQSQIEDIQRRNNAIVAALRDEVQQQRLQDIEEQQKERFADIVGVENIVNPLLERFRSSTIPDTQETRFTETLNEGGPRASAKAQEDVFPDDEEPPGISIDEFENEDGLPVAKAEFETQRPIRAFINAPPSGLGEPPTKIRSKKSQEQIDLERRTIVVDSVGFAPIPPPVTTTLNGIKRYYEDLISNSSVRIPIDTSLKTKNDYYKAVYEIIDDIGLTLASKSE